MTKKDDQEHLNSIISKFTKPYAGLIDAVAKKISEVDVNAPGGAEKIAMMIKALPDNWAKIGVLHRVQENPDIQIYAKGFAGKGQGGIDSQGESGIEIGFKANLGGNDTKTTFIFSGFSAEDTEKLLQAFSERQNGAPEHDSPEHGDPKAVPDHSAPVESHPNADATAEPKEQSQIVSQAVNPKDFQNIVSSDIVHSKATAIPNPVPPVLAASAESMVLG